MGYIKVVSTGHVIEVYEMQHPPFDISKYRSPEDEYNALEGIKHDGSLSASILEEYRNKLLLDIMEKEAIKEQFRESRKEERRAQTMRDSKNRCRRYAIANFTSDDTFMTLTYKENFQDVTESDKHFKAFIRKFKKKIGQPKLKYLAVREFQKRGAVHYHFVCDWKEPSKYVDNEEHIKAMERAVATYWGYGFVDIKPMNKAKTKNHKYNGKPIDNIGAYLTKYMTKEFDDDRLQGKKIYLNSQGLEKPKEFTGEEAEAIIAFYKLGEKKETFANSYASEHLGNITYKEYNLKRI